MIGRLFCIIWAHRWHYMFTNGNSRGVFHCSRCATVKADKDKS